jgi:hypothetical protein
MITKTKMSDNKATLNEYALQIIDFCKEHGFVEDK